MILLHLVVAALYAYAAWVLWPISSATRSNSLPPGPPKEDSLPLGGTTRGAKGAHDPATSAPSLRRPASELAIWLVAVALIFHAWLVSRSIATPDGLDLSLDHALSVVAGLAVGLAWASGLLRALPAMGTIVLPVAAVASLLPVLIIHRHRFPYAAEPWAAAHVAIALLGYALFIVAALHALALMGMEKRLRRRLPDPQSNAMPLLTLERFLFRLIAAGFVLLTLTVISGVLFSEEVFGRPFMFTHKTVFSVLGWITFGALLWGRWRYGWRGRIALRWILAGTGFLLLAYLGTKFVVEVVLGR